MNPARSLRRWFAGLTLAALAGTVQALPTTFSGFLDDCAGNAALVYSDLGPPKCDDDFTIANNVAVHSFSLAAQETVSFTSTGFAAGGVDPYFTLFSGIGNGATFLLSNHDHAFFGPGGDFVISPVVLPAGGYTVAIGAFANMSFAENLGSGTLGDGFVALGFGNLGTTFYELTVAGTEVPARVPEPSTVVLLAATLFALALTRRVRIQR